MDHVSFIVGGYAVTFVAVGAHVSTWAQIQ